jgi:dihydropteroate synthase
MRRYVFAFSEGDKDQKDLLGGKDANLAEMVRRFLAGRMREAEAAGVRRDLMVVDPGFGFGFGFGFGKTFPHNVTLLHELRQFTTLGALSWPVSPVKA